MVGVCGRFFQLRHSSFWVSWRHSKNPIFIATLPPFLPSTEESWFIGAAVSPRCAPPVRNLSATRRVLYMDCIFGLGVDNHRHLNSRQRHRGRPCLGIGEAPIRGRQGIASEYQRHVSEIKPMLFKVGLPLGIVSSEVQCDTIDDCLYRKGRHTLAGSQKIPEAIEFTISAWQRLQA